VDPDQRNKEMVSAVAKRVGFKLPDEAWPHLWHK
jgi:hypothetical protein